MAAPNIPAALRATTDRLGPRAALRSRRDGLYRDLSWIDYRRRAIGAAAALVELGIRPGDRVGILAENRAEWPIADIAILAAGAVDVPLHAPLAPKQVEYQLQHSGARGVIVSDQGQANKVLEVLDGLPGLEWIASFEPIADVGWVPQFTWDGLIQRGQGSPGATAEVRRRESTIGRDELATIIYTSGTTGLPKGVMLTHGNLLSNAEVTVANSDAQPDDVILSWLPYSHIYARTCDLYVSIVGGAVLALAESIETLPRNLAEIRPSCMSAVPRFYEKIWAGIEHLPIEARRSALGKVFGPRVRHFSSGGAPLPKHVARGFHESGLTLMEGYGLTESSPVISFNRLDSFKVGSVGLPVPGVEVKFADDGEILTRGPHVMKGYWNDPEATRLAINDGWLATGDVGYLDEDGFLYVTDRKKDIIITSGGKNVAPSEIERLLISDPYIDQAVVHGDGKPCITALIVPNFEALRVKATELGCVIETDGDFIRPGPLHQFLAGRIERLMEAVSQPERVRAFLLLARPFAIEAGELTPTLKVRRRQILKNFHDQLDALYDAREGAGRPGPGIMT